MAREAVNGVDQILHLAAAKGDWGISREEYYRDNLEATRNVIEAGAENGVKDWVFYSTVSTLGPHYEAVDEHAGFNAINSYGASKAEAEKLFHQLAEDDPEARVLIIRPSVVYGPGNPPSTNIYRLVDAIYNHRFAMVGPGDAIKSTSYIENLLEATLFLMERMEQGVQTYIYVDEPAPTTGTLVERIYKLLGKSPPSWYIPLSVASPIATVSDWAADLTGIDFPITAARIEKFNRSTNFDATKIREEGYEQPVSNREALRETVEWHLQHEYGETLRNGR
ncbi:nucleoside-diphosphate-sugar epimerase [Salinibacter ruber]|nr:nucleoside-diphosphate-sugar epimerase [Salinibacter ruber]MCS4143817.1 nucleoside-diphosphate-sugar epimerase [Salinibacter ruber]